MPQQNPLCELYEKLYFHEIEAREHLSARVQVPLAITVSLIGVLAFMLLNFNKELCGLPTFLFLFFLVLSSSALIVGIFFLIRSWYGHTYSFLPSAAKTEDYRQILVNTYSGYDNSDDLTQGHLNDYLCNYFVQCSTVNTHCNDKRSLYLHKANGSLIITVLLAAVAFLFFYFGGLDKNQTIKPVEISIVQPVEFKDITMADEKSKISPPPPPPPPPVRLIKEGVEIVNPPGKKDGK